MLDFVAIDFETANSRADSACQFAVVVVEGGAITHEASWLVRPPRLYFSPQNIAVHGILPEHVKDQPNFSEVWKDCRAIIEGRILVAHNARFDLGVLTSTLAAYDIAVPRLDFSCTRLIAQRCWPGHHSYGLAAIAERFDIRFQHHDALEDSRTCAEIALRAANEVQAESFDSLERKLSITRGSVSLGHVASPKTIKRSRNILTSSESSVSRRTNSSYPEVSYGPQGVPGRSSKLDVSINSERIQHLAGDAKPLSGRTIVFTGKLMGLSRAEAIQLATSLGAICPDEIGPTTDYVVAGPPDRDQGSSLATPNLTQLADLSNSKGKPIRLLSERQFVQLLPGGLANVEIQIKRRR
jgi:DNA polymerase-3 subunit epsilon